MMDEDKLKEAARDAKLKIEEVRKIRDILTRALRYDMSSNADREIRSALTLIGTYITGEKPAPTDKLRERDIVLIHELIKATTPTLVIAAVHKWLHQYADELMPETHTYVDTSLAEKTMHELITKNSEEQ